MAATSRSVARSVRRASTSKRCRSSMAGKLRGARGPIEGAKGGGKGGGKGKSARETSDQVASREIARVMEVIGHGPMGGPTDFDALKVFKFDGTPARNLDGTDNFTGVTLELRTGE